MTQFKDPAFAVASGNRLRAAPVALGFNTLRSMADATGVHEDRYRSWENGSNLVPPEYVMQLFERWGVTHDWIYRGDHTGLSHRLYKAIKAVI